MAVALAAVQHFPGEAADSLAVVLVAAVAVPVRSLAADTEARPADTLAQAVVIALPGCMRIQGEHSATQLSEISRFGLDTGQYAGYHR